MRKLILVVGKTVGEDEPRTAVIRAGSPSEKDNGLCDLDARETGEADIRRTADDLFATMFGTSFVETHLITSRVGESDTSAVQRYWKGHCGE